MTELLLNMMGSVMTPSALGYMVANVIDRATNIQPRCCCDENSLLYSNGRLVPVTLVIPPPISARR